MKVLFIIDSLQPGGAEKMAVLIANEWAKHGSSALLVTRGTGLLEDQVSNEVTLLKWRKTGKFDVQFLRKLIKYVNAHEIEVIHAHSSSIYQLLLLPKFLLQAKLIWHVHYNNTSKVSKAIRMLLRFRSNVIDHFIVVNKDLENWSRQFTMNRKITYLQNFIGRQAIPLNAPRRKQIIMVANLRFEKNHQMILNVFRELEEELADWELHLIGKNFNDAYSINILNLVSQDKRVHYLGEIGDVSSHLQNASIAVLCSHTEGLPVALLEYGIHGLAVVVTDVGACREVVGDTAILIKPRDSAGLRQALVELTQDEDLREGLGDKLKQRIAANFTPQAAVVKLKKIYESA